MDGGLIYCKDLGLRPALIVGDFDSCPLHLLEEYANVPQILLPRDKDQTDLEVAIAEEFRRGAKKITLFGAWGKRVDHSLVNVLLLTRHPGKLFLETETELLFGVGKNAIFSSFPGQTLSLIPLDGPVLGITTKGLKWELNEGQIDQSFIGISNICLGREVEISIKKGILICCLIKEKL